MSEQDGERDDGLREALRGLPAATPGPAFTARVLAQAIVPVPVLLTHPLLLPASRAGARVVAAPARDGCAT